MDKQTNLDEAKSKKDRRVATGFVFMTLSYVSFNVFYFLSRILLANFLSLEDYGILTYAWAVGTTTGFLLMIGREQDALVEIPRMNLSQLLFLRRSLVRIFLGSILVLLAVFALSSLFLTINVELLAIIGFAISNTVFQIQYYSLIGLSDYRSHFILNIGYYGSTFFLIWFIGSFWILTLELSIVVLILLLIASNLLGTVMASRSIMKSNPSLAASNDSTRPLEIWSFTRFEKTNLRYFFVDIVATFIPLVPVLTLQFFVGYEEVAIIGVAFIFYRLSTFFGRVVHAVYSSFLSESFKADTREFTRLLKESIGLTIFLQGLSTISIGALAIEIITLFVDVRYSLSALILQILLLGTIFDSLYNASSSILRNSGRSQSLFVVNLITLISMLIISIPFASLLGIIGVSLSFSVVLTIQGITALFMIRRDVSSYYTNIIEKMYFLKLITWCILPILLLVILIQFTNISRIIILLVGCFAFIGIGHFLNLLKISVLVNFIRILIGKHGDKYVLKTK